MRVLVAGSGAREHALAWACRRDRGDVEVICAPGNGGTSSIARNVDVAADDPAGIVRCARDNDVDLVVIGPDAALAAGVADACHAAGIAAFGPTAAAARIESSKSFAKQLMDGARIPTARWMSGGGDRRNDLLGFVDDLGGACVVKADGLALGKGVVVCDDAAQARDAVAACLDEQRFGAAGATVIIEERLSGSEVTVLALTDGEHLRILPTARDYKRIGDGDTGPNTGGMGAMTPVPGLDQTLLAEVERDILAPCIGALADLGTPFAGCLYAQLMLTADGPRVVEFNARFGDPEAQVVLPAVGEDVVSLLGECASASLTPGRVALADLASTVGVVLAAAGYPGDPRRGDVITGLDALGDGILAFHAGTRREDDGTLRTAGGRVLTLVARAAAVAAARDEVYAAVEGVQFEGVQYRHDIASSPR